MSNLSTKTHSEPGALCAELEPFVLRILDESMAPELIPGSIVIIDPSVQPFQSCLVLAELDQALVIRMFHPIGDTFVLKALRTGYPTIPASDVTRIRGVVSQRAGTRRRDHRRYPLRPPE